MECPKCHAKNSDDAVCCSLCYHPFKGKPAPSAAAPAAPSPSRAFVPAGDVTVSYYGTVNLSRGPYLALQSSLFIFIFAVLIWIYSMTDADMTAKLPPNPPPEVTGAAIRSAVKFWMWLAFVWECAATWYFLSLFAKKERAAS